METIKTFTTVTDEARFKSMIAATRIALNAVLTHLNLSPESSLYNNDSFLSEFAREIVVQLQKQGIEKYGAIVGAGLVRVLRYQKDTLVTINWKELTILLYQCPGNPQFPIENVPFPSEISQSDLNAKYCVIANIG